MDLYDHDDLLDSQIRAREFDDDVRAEFPDHADEARAFINTILRRDAKQKWLAFNGEGIDRECCLGELHMAHYLVSETFKRRDEGVEIPPFYPENTVRLWAGLGFTVIDGGQKDEPV